MSEDPWKETDPAKDRPAGPEQDPEEFYKAGVFLLKRNRAKEALVAFKQALELRPTDPRFKSYFGLALAVSENRVKEALRICESTVEKEFFRSELYLNLGRVYLMAGNRRKAHQAFRKGLALDRDSNELKFELDRMGVRKQPVLPFLDRRHALNKLAGKLLHRLRLR
ncbi:MAG: tetratricopeptide repeat protein [Nitrospirae bacterium]|nr:tetratricopeptide repeat protein [Nitrospirota bacterium]